jgi:2'-5' RNA ligase
VHVHRLFIAISIPDGIKDEIARVQGELKQTLAGADVRWTRRTQFHLTLKFFGNVPVTETDRLIQTVQEAARMFAPLRLRVAGLGAFPHLRSPRVLWMGVNDQGNTLVKLQAAIADAVHTFTEEEAEGKFSGHVTLGRVGGLNRFQVERFAKLTEALASRSPGEWTAAEVEIIRSELSTDGSRYTTLAQVPLSGTN